jgi:hypothetical protein
MQANRIVLELAFYLYIFRNEVYQTYFSNFLLWFLF